MKKIRIIGVILIVLGLFLGIFGKLLPKIPSIIHQEAQSRHQSEMKLALKPGQVAGLVSITPMVGTTSGGIDVETPGVVEVIYLNGYHEKVSSEGAPRWIPTATWRYSFLLKNISEKEVKIRISAMNPAETPRIVNYDNAGDYLL